jgi:hypothetical protein
MTIMKEEDIDREWVYGKNTTMDDLSDEQIEWLEENDPDRLGEIGENTNDMYRDMMFPDGLEDD